VFVTNVNDDARSAFDVNPNWTPADTSSADTPLCHVVAGPATFTLAYANVSVIAADPDITTALSNGGTATTTCLNAVKQGYSVRWLHPDGTATSPARWSAATSARVACSRRTPRRWPDRK
jgi:hypothetical protein